MTHRTLRNQLLRLITAVATILGLFHGHAPRTRAVQAGSGTVGTGSNVSCTPAALQSVLDSVQGTGGGLIDFDCGEAPHTIVVAATLQITSSVSFDGGALGDITLSGGDARRIFINLGGALSLTDMVVAHGKVDDGYGGCIYNTPGVLTLLRSIVHTCQSGPSFAPTLGRPAAPAGSAASGGGAIYNWNGAVTLVNSEVLSSSAQAGGGIQSFGSLSLMGSRLAGNTARDFGGGLAATGAITITNSRVEHNDSLALAGGIGATSAAQLTLAGSQVYSNTAVTDGGGIYSAGALTITTSHIDENVAGANGGGLNVGLGTASFDQAVVAGNQAGLFGGGIFSDQPLVLTDTEVLSNTGVFAGGGASVAAITLMRGLFRNNRCTEGGCDGGGLSAGGALMINGIHFISNTSQSGGGGGANAGGATIIGGLFQENHCLAAGCNGGGLRAGSLALTDTQFIGNSAITNGGGAYAAGATTVSGGLFQDNHTTVGDGGGLYSDGHLWLSGTDFTGNTSTGDGGGVFAFDAVTLTDGFFRDNSCAEVGCYGGGLLTFSSLALTRTQFISNSASSRGGGVYANSATLNSGVFQDNACRTGGCRGGGLFGSTLALTDTQFINNTSAGNGGAVHVGSGRLVNALFVRNSAAGNGAALYLDGVGLTTILHNTIAGPTLSTGAAAIDVAGAGTVGITNTVVASHSVGISRTAGTVYEDYNLFFDTPAVTAGGVISGGHSFSGNPAFADPALDNYHLGAGSAAIDKGVNAGVTLDIDVEPRPLDAGFDIGFDEFALRVLYLPLFQR